jgi:hypothetical protein
MQLRDWERRVAENESAVLHFILIKIICTLKPLYWVFIKLREKRTLKFSFVKIKHFMLKYEKKTTVCV